LSVIDGFEGDIDSETSGAVTVTWVEALMVPTDAVIVVVPSVRELTIPELPAALLTLATAGDDELHTTEARVPRLTPSWVVPVATRGRVAPGTIGWFDGEMVIDAREGRDKLEGTYESTLDRVTPLLMPPASRTVPSVRSVAVRPERPVLRAWLVVKLSLAGLKSSVVESDVQDDEQAS